MLKECPFCGREYEADKEYLVCPFCGSEFKRENNKQTKNNNIIIEPEYNDFIRRGVEFEIVKVHIFMYILPILGAVFALIAIYFSLYDIKFLWFLVVSGLFFIFGFICYLFYKKSHN